VLAGLGLWRARDPLAAWRDRWSNAKIERLTDFPGSEVDAAISPGGDWVAFLADRDSVFDAYAGSVARADFANLTGGRLPQLFNQDVRNIGFAADGAHIWIRVADISAPASVSLVPLAGGPARPFLPSAVMAVWSPDGAALTYHETTPGDPIYVAGRAGEQPRRVFGGPPGVHAHYLAWSPDGRFLYFSHGLPPDGMDIWRIPAAGGAAEQITRHNSRVAYPVLLDDQTLAYTATADDGTGPWLYLMNLSERVPRRWTAGVEHYLSIAAAGERPGQARPCMAERAGGSRASGPAASCTVSTCRRTGAGSCSSGCGKTPTSS
jgi:dipeptidyl aminopeptidase/acylaminoacyl peptidase